MKAALILLVAAPMLGGCVASMAASAVGAAVQAATGGERPAVTQDLRSAATDACRARAADSQDFRVIDVEQQTDGDVTVWGTLQSPQGRRSFECRYRGRVVAFRLREIGSR